MFWLKSHLSKKSSLCSSCLVAFLQYVDNAIVSRTKTPPVSYQQRLRTMSTKRRREYLTKGMDMVQERSASPSRPGFGVIARFAAELQRPSTIVGLVNLMQDRWL